MRWTRGQALVEFALVGAVALLMMMGILEMGRLLFSYHLVSNAARLGSRYAIVHGSDCGVTLPGCGAASPSDVQAYVRSVSPGVDPASLTVTTVWSDGTNCLGGAFKGTGCTVTVTANYTFQSVVPLLNLAPIPISSSSQMIISQ